MGLEQELLGKFPNFIPTDYELVSTYLVEKICQKVVQQQEATLSRLLNDFHVHGMRAGASRHFLTWLQR